jgi:hypothetical protein
MQAKTTVGIINTTTDDITVEYASSFVLCSFSAIVAISAIIVDRDFFDWS